MTQHNMIKPLKWVKEIHGFQDKGKDRKRG